MRVTAPDFDPPRVFKFLGQAGKHQLAGIDRAALGGFGRRAEIPPAGHREHRPPPPEDLIPQFPLVRDATRAFGVSCVEMAGYEADDFLAAAVAAALSARKG